MTRTQKIIQGTYLFLFVIMSFGIVGNMQVGDKTPLANLIAYGIVTFLTVGKIAYRIKKIIGGVS